MTASNANGARARLGGLLGRGGDKPARYSAGALARKGLTGEAWPRVWRDHDLKKTYDVIIIGAGVHGLATAYYLAKNHGITDVAAGELCDDGNSVPDDGCTNNCKAPGCGDGILQADEQCDDGNSDNNDACLNSCSWRVPNDHGSNLCW